MNRKTFSIIAATYNCGQKIEATIRSVLAQNKDLFELIIVDGASTDDTLEYVKKYENQLTLVSEKDGGIYYAFNKGIDLATGEYLYFIGAGDTLRADVLERVGELLPKEENLAFVYGDMYLKKKEVYESGERGALETLSRTICHQSTFYHRSIFDLIGKYDTEYKIYSDWVFCWKCLGDKRVKKTHIDCVIAEFEGGGISETAEDYQFLKDAPRLIRNHLGIRFYLFHKATRLPADVYWKIYHPFLRPLLRRVKRLKVDTGKQR